MASKDSNSSKSSSEKGLKVMTADCGCTYLGDPKTGAATGPMPSMDSKKRTSWCGKTGGSSGECRFL